MDKPMWLGWYDGDRKKTARAKLAEAVDRYREKFGREPKYCLASVQDAEELAAPHKSLPEPSVEVHARNYISRWTFYVGESASGQPVVMTSEAAG